MHGMSSLRQARKMHRDRWHVHGSSQDGMVLLGVHSLFLIVLINVKHLVVGWANTAG